MHGRSSTSRSTCVCEMLDASSEEGQAGGKKEQKKESKKEPKKVLVKGKKQKKVLVNDKTEE